LLAARRLAVAVLEPTRDEPLLVACATLVLDETPGASDFAPGLLETASAADTLALPHVAALDDAWCRVEASTEDAATGLLLAGATDSTLVEVQGRPELRVIASPTATARAAERFHAARLRLIALDCAGCALLSLASSLGRASATEAAAVIEEAKTLDPLTAVSVAPECEAAAARAAEALAVPIGLALAHFGGLDRG
jgi:hypothetical protein